MRTIEHKLLPKQYDFVGDEKAREILYSGAFAAGKTRSLCFKLVKRASVVGQEDLRLEVYMIFSSTKPFHVVQFVSVCLFSPPCAAGRGLS